MKFASCFIEAVFQIAYSSHSHEPQFARLSFEILRLRVRTNREAVGFGVPKRLPERVPQMKSP